MRPALHFGIPGTGGVPRMSDSGLVVPLELPQRKTWRGKIGEHNSSPRKNTVLQDVFYRRFRRLASARQVLSGGCAACSQLSRLRPCWLRGQRRIRHLRRRQLAEARACRRSPGQSVARLALSGAGLSARAIKRCAHASALRRPRCHRVANANHVPVLTESTGVVRGAGRHFGSPEPAEMRLPRQRHGGQPERGSQAKNTNDTPGVGPTLARQQSVSPSGRDDAST